MRDQADLEALSTPYDDEPLRQQTMKSILENRASALGSKTFIDYGPEERSVSFADANDVANAIANGLLDLGIEPGAKVSTLLRHPLETLLVMFGINKAGAVYAPINFEYRGSALSYQLNDTDPDVLFLEDRYADRLDDVQDDLDRLPQVVLFETDAEAADLDSAFETVRLADLKDRSSSTPDVDLSWDDEASIVYTSGTTGMPKGVVLPHRWIFGNYTLANGQLLDEGDVVHTSLPMYHVAGAYSNVAKALSAGASVALWDRFSASEFWDRIDKYDVTVATLLSVMIPWLNNQEESPDDHRNTLKRVHMQPLPDNYDELAERFGFEFVTVGFGQTESGSPLGAIIHANPGGVPDDLVRGKSPEAILETAEDLGIPVVDEVPGDRFMGKPRYFMEADVVDDRDESLPPGETGELVFRPKQAGIVLEEYYNKPERTVEALSNLWFHTGDAAYRDEDGHFYFVDRIGDVIRRRGENISSMQIQDVVTGYEDVAQAAVFPVTAPEGGEDRIGTAVEPAGDAFSESALEEYLVEELPEFMQPDHLLVLDSLPTTETNKIEKYKLRETIEESDDL